MQTESIRLGPMQPGLNIPQADEENQLSLSSTTGLSSNEGDTAPGKRTPEGANGYLWMAQLMGEMPSFGIFRRFGDLNALSLLFYQAELFQLEKELMEQIRDDARSGDEERRRIDKDWNRASPTDPQRIIMAKIRPIMEKYGKQILLQHELIKVPKPTTLTIEYMRDWMKGDNMGNARLEGIDRRAWLDTYVCEMVALQSQRSEDALSAWITGRLLKKYHRLIGHIFHTSDEKKLQNSSVYSETGMARTISITIIGLSSIFPISSILLLNHFKEEKQRMIILCIYTLAFSVILAAVSGAKRVEVFSAAAAFAAVQVVFIGQNK